MVHFISLIPHIYCRDPSTQFCFVPQGSVLVPVLFNLYTTPLSSLINASSISYLLYADDTQLFIYFVSKNFSSAINNLQSSITFISSSNYLTLNPSKTEFILIGLPQQTSKIVNPSLSLPTTKPIMPSLSAKNVSFIFDSTLSFSKQISSLSSTFHYYIRDLRRIRHTLDSTTAATIAIALVHSRLDYCNSLYHGLSSLKLSDFNIFKMDLHVLLLALPNILTSPQCSSPIIGSKLNNEFNIRSSSLHTTSFIYKQTKVPSQAHKYQTSLQNSFLRSSVFFPPVSTRLKFADRSFRNSSPRLWNSLPINLRSFAADTHLLHHSHQLYSFPPLQSTLSFS